MKKWQALVVTMIVFGWQIPIANAAPVWHTSTLHSVYPLANGQVVIRFTTDSSQCTDVNSPSYHRLGVNRNGVSADAFKNMYSAFMAALAMGAQVSVNFDDSTGECYINRMYVVG